MTALYIGDGVVRYSDIKANLGDSVLLQQPHGEVNLYTLGGEFKWTLDHSIRTDTQPVFYSPNYVLVTDGNQLWKRSLDRVSTAELIASFPDYITLSVEHAEGDLTRDGYLALCGVAIDGTEYVFLYNIYTRAQGKAFKHFEKVDGIKATVQGYLIVSGDSGIYVYPPLTLMFQITPKNGHACPAEYNGKPVFLWCSNARAQDWDNSVEMYDVITGQFIRELMDFGTQNYAMHISAGPDAAYVSVYDPTLVLKNQIWRAPLDGSAPVLLHEWQPKRYLGEQSTPMATYSEGKILFKVDDGSVLSTWYIEDSVVSYTPSTVKVSRTRIDYSSYVGKSRFIMEPRPDGSVDIYEEKL